VSGSLYQIPKYT